MPVYDGNHLVIQLSGNPQTTTNPLVMDVTSAAIHDAGDGTWGFDVSAFQMEEIAGPYSGSTATYTINGVAYNSTSEIDTGSIFIDNQQVFGYYVHLMEFTADGSGLLNSGSFFFPLAGEDVSFVVPGTSTVTSTGQNDTHTPMPYGDIALAPVCFTAGVRINTEDGEVAVEDLKLGQLVNTLDHGLQPIRWIGRRTVKNERHFAPIMIKKGALGNTRDLRVSQQHRMLITGWKAELLFGDSQVLVPAKDLVNGDSIYVCSDGGDIEYFHIMFDTHQIIFGDGTPSESFYPNEVALSNLEEATRSEIYSLFPELKKTPLSYGLAARPTLQPFEVDLLNN